MSEFSGFFGAPARSIDILSRPSQSSVLDGLDPSSELSRIIADGGSVTNYLNASLGAGTNLVMNGSMQIWQRKTSFTSVANNAVTADRWRYLISFSAAVHDVTKSEDVPDISSSHTGIRSGSGFVNSLRLNLTTGDTSVGATDLVWIRQAIEYSQWFKFTRKPLVLSFWVKATKTGTYSVVIGDTTAYSDAAGTGVSYISSYTVDTTNTWEKKVIVIPAHTGSIPASAPFHVGFVLMAGTNYHATGNVWANQSQKYAVAEQVNGVNDATTCANFYLTGVQIEAGNIATAFNHIDFTTELLQCMRYYEKSFHYATTPAYGVSWTLGRPAVGIQVVAASTHQPIIAQAVFRVPKFTAASGSNTVLYNPVTASSAQFRNITAAADCTANAYTSASEDHLTFSSTTAAGSAVGQVMALHWATDVEI